MYVGYCRIGFVWFWGKISKLGKNREKNVVPRRPDLFPVFRYRSWLNLLLPRHLILCDLEPFGFAYIIGSIVTVYPSAFAILLSLSVNSMEGGNALTKRRITSWQKIFVFWMFMFRSSRMMRNIQEIQYKEKQRVLQEYEKLRHLPSGEKSS